MYLFISQKNLPLHRKVEPFNGYLKSSLATEKLIQILNEKQNHTQRKQQKNPKPKTESLVFTTQIVSLLTPFVLWNTKADVLH